jgi:tRNA(Ile)-lysidine synthase
MKSTNPIEAAFAGAMDRLGPFEPTPLLAIAVSGGADSLALAMLADMWARARGGSIIGLVVDHGLRPEAAEEARATERLLAAHSIAARVLRLAGLAHGSALAERARAARYQALIAACASAGALHLLVGHHRADQAETVALRALRGSFSAGLAGMAGLVELPTVRLLRPLLGLPPGGLRALLRARRISWVEDPSNHDKHYLRVRLRLLASDRDGPDTALLATAATWAGAARQTEEMRAARVLGGRVAIRPEGFAVIAGGSMPPSALGALIQAIAGAPYAPAPDAVAALAARPIPATLAGIRLLSAGRLGPGLLVVREVAAMAAPIRAIPGAVWDGRYRMAGDIARLSGATLGALDCDARLFRDCSALPSVVLRTLPAVRRGATVLAVPHLNFPNAESCARIGVLFVPPRPAAGPPFRPLGARP